MTQASGILKLWCKRGDGYPWGVLEMIEFDDAARRKSQRRRGALRTLRTRLSGWVHNYEPFRNASFAIEEQEDQYSRPRHIQGQRRDREEKRSIKRKLMDDPVRRTRIIRKLLDDEPEETVVVEHKVRKVKEAPLPKRGKLVKGDALKRIKQAARAQQKNWRDLNKQKGKRK